MKHSGEELSRLRGELAVIDFNLMSALEDEGLALAKWKDVEPTIQYAYAKKAAHKTASDLLSEVKTERVVF